MLHPREGEVQVLQQTPAEKREQVLPPMGTPREKGVLSYPGGYAVDEEGQTTPAPAYLDLDEARAYIQFEVDRITEEIASTENVTTLRLLQIGVQARNQLFKDISQVKIGEPVGYEMALSKILEPLLIEAGLMVDPESEVAPVAPPVPDLSPSGVPIHRISPGTRSIPGD